MPALTPTKPTGFNAGTLTPTTPNVVATLNPTPAPTPIPVTPTPITPAPTQPAQPVAAPAEAAMVGPKLPASQPFLLGIANGLLEVGKKVLGTISKNASAINLPQQIMTASFFNPEISKKVKDSGVNIFSMDSSAPDKLKEILHPEEYKLIAEAPSIDVTGVAGELEALGPRVARLFEAAVAKGVGKETLTKIVALGEKTLAPIEKSSLLKSSTQAFIKSLPEDVQQRAVVMNNLKTNEIMTQRRGIIPDKKMIEMISKGDNVLEELAAAEPGTILPFERGGRIKGDLADAILKATSAEELAKVAELVPKARGVLAETGRALSAQRKVIVEGVQEKLLKAIGEATDPVLKTKLADLANLIGGEAKIPGFMDKLTEWAVAIKIAAPNPHIRSMLGNAMSRLIKTPEQLVSAGIEQVRAAITGRPAERFVREAIADAIGTIQGFKEGAVDALRALKDEGFAAGSRRIEESMTTSRGAIGGTLGKVVRAPFRLTGAVDAFWKAAGNKGALNSMAMREGLMQGLGGEKLMQFVDNLVKNPTPKMLESIEKEVKRLVFQSDLTGMAESFNQLRNKHPALKLIVPFWKTPVNIMKAVVKGTPLSLLTPSTMKALKIGGGEAADVISRMVVGSSVLTGLTMYALDGNITGKGPESQAEKDALYRKGWQPYSIKIGNNYYSYRGLEPFSAYLTMASQIAEMKKAPSIDQAGKALWSIVGDFTNQPFMTGMSDLFDAMTDPERSLPKFLGTFFTGLTIPNGISWAAKIMDPTFRKPSGIFQTFESKLPGLSQRVAPILDAFGNTSQRQNPASPVAVSSAKTNIVEHELDRLGVTIGFPAKSAFGTKLNSEDYQLLQRTTGQTTFSLLTQIMSTDKYKNADPRAQEKVINQVVTEVRDRVKLKYFKEEALLQKIRSALEKKGYTSDRATMIAPEVLQNIKKQNPNAGI